MANTRRATVRDWSDMFKWISFAIVALSFAGIVAFWTLAPQPEVSLISQKQNADFWANMGLMGWSVFILFCVFGIVVLYALAGFVHAKMIHWHIKAKIVDGAYIDDYKGTVNGERHKFTTIADIRQPQQFERNGTVGVKQLGGSIPSYESRRRQVEAKSGGILDMVHQVRATVSPKAALNHSRLQRSQEQLRGHRLINDGRELANQNRQLMVENRQIKQGQMLSKPDPEPEPGPEVWVNTDARVAFGQSSYENICVAQVANGEFVHWNHREDGAHIRVHGETGSGKTQLALGFVGQMIRLGWQVVIMDRRKFKNYKAIEGCAQFVDTTNIEVMKTALEEIERIHAERDITLGEYGADDIGELDSPPARICVVIDEFTAQMIHAEQARIDKEILDMLVRLTAESRATGIHFLFCDQKPVARIWGDIMRANVTACFAGFMPKGQGRTTTGSDMGQKLGGHRFWMERSDQFVRGWNVKPLLQQKRHMLPNLPQDIIDVGGTVRMVEAKERIEHQGHSPKMKTCLSYMAENPGCTQGEMRRYTGVSKGMASKAWNHYHSNNERVH